MSVLTSFTTAANQEGEAVGDSGDVEYTPAQSFQIPSTSTINKVSLYLYKDANVPTDDLTVRIETDSSGSPSGTLANANATTTIAPASVGTDVAFVDATFSTTFNLTGGTTYWLKASVPAQATGKRYIWNANTAGGYASGEAKIYYTGAWNDPGNHDLLFKIWGELGGSFLLNFI